MEALIRSKASAGEAPNLPPQSGLLSRSLTLRSLVDVAAGFPAVEKGLDLRRGEEGTDGVVYAVERRGRGHVPAAPEAFGVDEVGEDLARPGEDGAGGEEDVLLRGEHGHRPLEAPELLLARHPRQP